MRLAIHSHCTIDSVGSGAGAYEAPGGAACYGGAAARRLGAGVVLRSRHGGDFAPHLALLDSEGIAHEGSLCGSPTTRLEVSRAGLRVSPLCEPVPPGACDCDGAVLSPVCGEVSEEGLRAAVGSGAPAFVGAAGFLRRRGPGGAVSLAGPLPDVSGAAAVHAGPGELEAAGLGAGAAGLRALGGLGAGPALLTEWPSVRMLDGERTYSLEVPGWDAGDAAGLADIFLAAFAATSLREGDPLWALCFAAGAAQAALGPGPRGPARAPRRRAVESNASYFYNTVGFE